MQSYLLTGESLWDFRNKFAFTKIHVISKGSGWFFNGESYHTNIKWVLWVIRGEFIKIIERCPTIKVNIDYNNI